MHLHLIPRFMQLSAALRWRRDALGRRLSGRFGGARDAVTLCSEAGSLQCIVGAARRCEV